MMQTIVLTIAAIVVGFIGLILMILLLALTIDVLGDVLGIDLIDVIQKYITR